MPTFAVDRSLAEAAHVLLQGDRFEVRGLNARCDVAEVIDLAPLGDRPIEVLLRPAMQVQGFPCLRYDSISVVSLAAHPYEASVFGAEGLGGESSGVHVVTLHLFRSVALIAGTNLRRR